MPSATYNGNFKLYIKFQNTAQSYTTFKNLHKHFLQSLPGDVSQLWYNNGYTYTAVHLARNPLGKALSKGSTTSVLIAATSANQRRV